MLVQLVIHVERSEATGYLRRSNPSFVLALQIILGSTFSGHSGRTRDRAKENSHFCHDVSEGVVLSDVVVQRSPGEDNLEEMV